jgi:hypothetical protein
MIPTAFQYIEVWAGQASPRRLIHVGQYQNVVQPLAAAGYPVHCSMFIHTEELVRHAQRHGGTRGYHGEVYGPSLCFDIDRPGDLAAAIADTLQLIGRLSTIFGITDTQTYFSGAKGFHIMVPATCFGSELAPSEDLPAIHRAVALHMAGEIKIDAGIYGTLNLLRQCNTRNEKSGLFKIRIYPGDGWCPEFIRGWAHWPREDVPLTSATESVQAQRVVQDIKNHQQQHAAMNQRPSSVSGGQPCLQRLWHGLGEGECGGRNNAAWILTTKMRDLGMPFDAVCAALTIWNQKNNPPLDNGVFDHNVRRAFADDRHVGCQHPLLASLCSDQCFRKANSGASRRRATEALRRVSLQHIS